MTRAVRVDGWRVWLPARDAGRDPVGGGAPPSAARTWLRLVAEAEDGGEPLHSSKHASTYRLRVADGDIYLKTYRRYRLATSVKDLARPSKARHVAVVSERLAAGAFMVPRVLAAGEERRGPWVRRAWVATAALAGEPLADRLAALAPQAYSADRGLARAALRAKRALLAAVGKDVARLHASGFIAGDLVPANVWVAAGRGEAEDLADRGRDATPPVLAFLDHDRTRALRGAVPWWRARRNLVQLNRVVLAGVVLTDRQRVYRAYAATRGFPPAVARRRLAWIVAKTIERRRRFDHVAVDPTTVSFRELMRAGGRWAPATGTSAHARHARGGRS